MARATYASRVAAYSSCQQWHRAVHGYRPTGPFPWKDTDATARRCAHRYRTARDYVGRKNTRARRRRLPGQHDAVIDFRRAHVDADHVGNPATAIHAVTAWQARAVAMT